MKVIIFICLIAQFLGRIIYLKKYGVTPSIYSGDGIVALDLSEFKEGDSIYITYDTVDGEYSELIYYNFTTTYPDGKDPNLLKGRQYCYSDGYTTIKHNVSDGRGGYRIYYTYNYHYFFEFKKPINETANYLLLGYDLTGYRLSSLTVDNTRFRRYIMTVIIVCSIVGGILLIVGISFLIAKRDDLVTFFTRLCSCYYCDCDCDCDCSDCCGCCDSLCHRTHSSQIIKKESKSFQLMEDYSSTSSEKKYDNKVVEEKPYYLSENHPDYIKPSEETPQYYPPPQNNLIDKPVATVNVVPPISQNIVVETPIPQPQQNLGPIPPPVYQVQENINNSQTFPPKPEEYPPQENIAINSINSSNLDINIPSENNDNISLFSSNQEQIQPRDNTNNNQNPPQNVENSNNGSNFTGGGGIYQ